MPRSTSVSEEVWAKAIHAVKVQKMSLRQAAQLYGVHHMSLHRRVRGRYSTTLPPSSDIRSFLSPDDEAEILGVLREQFLHEKRITSDDIRFVVRAIASQGGKRSIPPEFPPSRWIMDFKHAHGFAKLNSYAYPPMARTSSDQDMEDADDSGSNYSGYSMGSFARDEQEQQSKRARHSDADREDFGSNTSSRSYDTGTTTGSSSSGGSYENGENETRTYKLSHTVPPETWEKAIAAVEQQGMSLRAAARMYGVHFAALHRRVKKRAQGEQSSGMDGYFHPDDESGIIRVVVARAELGVLMSFDELMDLVQRAALRNLPDLSVEAARKLMDRFQTRNDHSIRHIITDWPLPRINSLAPNSAPARGASTHEAAAPRALPAARSQPAIQAARTYGRSSSMPSAGPHPRAHARSVPVLPTPAAATKATLPPLRSDLPPAPPAFLARAHALQPARSAPPSAVGLAIHNEREMRDAYDTDKGGRAQAIGARGHQGGGPDDESAIMFV